MDAKEFAEEFSARLKGECWGWIDPKHFSTIADYPEEEWDEETKIMYALLEDIFPPK